MSILSTIRPTLANRPGVAAAAGRRWWPLVATILALVLGAWDVTPAWAASIIRVKTTGTSTWPCGDTWATACALQTALTNAASGDEIWVAAGIYKPTDGTDRTATFQLENGVTVYGGLAGTETARDERDPAANVVILSGDLNGDDGLAWSNNGENSYHVVTCVTAGAAATLDGVTISGGNANGSDPYERGGGMYNINSVHPALTDVTFSGNSANWQGGGMYNGHSYPVLTRVVFSGNLATEGGGMFSVNSSPSLADVTFSDNSAEDGGGMYNESSSSTLTSVLLSENSATNSGGGMYNRSSGPTLTLTNVIFSDNLADNGGGLYNNASSPALTNVTFTGNSADLDGGGLYNNASSPALTHVTFSGNSADRGGGICNAAPGPVTRNSILWGNTARLGAQVYNAYSNAAFIDSVLQGGCPSDSVCTNVITADPLLGALGDYGGSTETFPLRPGSSALDAASSSCPATDQRGVARSTPVCDIGAFESQGFVLTITGGDHQSAPASTAFLEPLELTVTANDPLEPVDGGRVNFTGPSSGASIDPVTNVATITGGAASQLVTANALSGTYAVTPTVNAATSVAFSLENTAWVPVLYATPGGATTGFCDSWANACELRYALTRAVSGQEIWAKAGTYTPTSGADRGATFRLKSGVAVYGGFVGTETARDQRDPDAQVVILSGDLNGDDGSGWANNDENSYHVVTGATGATLDGVTISGGNANGIYSDQNKGGGIYNSNSSPTLSHVILSGNAASYTGGGLANESNSSPTLTHVVLSDNTAFTGGGMHNSGSSPALTDVAFSSNAASYSGGGLANDSNSNPALTNVTFSGNAADRDGGGLHNWGGSLALTNVTFSDNTAGGGGGGLFNWASNSTLTNVTFSGNTASNGGGLYNGGSPGNLQVRNSIFWANSGGEIVNSDGGTLTIRDSVVQGGYPGGMNIVTADPLIGALGDYGGSTETFPLLPGSSAIDAGNDTYCTLGHDQREASYVAGCDIGAFESQGFALTMTGGDNQTAPITTVFPQPLALTVTANDPAEPVDGGRVTFTGPSSGASTNPATNVATITGGAVALSVTANAITGSYTVTAGASGATGVDFTLTNSWTTVYSTTTTLVSSLNPSTYSTPVSFTATVASTGGTPTGSVQFYLDGAPLGLAVPLSDGQAALSTPLIEVGTHPISATYSGGPYYYGSASPTVSQMVDCGTAVTVLNADDSGAGSLRSAIAGACDGATITFGGDYTVTLTSMLTLDKDLTISGAGHTVGVSGNSATQVFAVNAGISVTLQNLTVAKGVASILNNGTLTIADSILNNNAGTVTNNSGATLTVLRATIANNTGGVWPASGPASAGILNRGVLTVTDSLFAGNQFTLRSDGGTAISNLAGGTAVVTGSLFDNNNAGPYVFGGGAIANLGQMTVDGCSFTGNSQPVGVYGGGAIVNNGAGVLTVTDSLFSHNVSGAAGGAYPGLGGAISHQSGALTVTGSTFDGNSAYGHGGAIAGLDSLSLTNNTFSENRAQPTSGDGWGGALVAAGDGSVSFNLTNNTFVSNTATTGGNLYFVQAGPTVSLHNNILLQGVSGGNCSFADGLTPTAGSNLADDDTCGTGFTNSSSINLGVLGDYGGATQTIPLLPGSAAIDAGDDTHCPATDQRGVTRPQGTQCDIGAFELLYTTPDATTAAATAVTFNGATLNGTVNANGSSTTVTFEYGLTTSYGTTVTASQSPVTGSTDTPVSYALSGLLPSTTYHYRVVATSAGGTTNGGDQSFTTPCAITVTNANDSGPGSLRQAIADVCAGGTITFAGDYTINLASQIHFEKGLTLSGAGHNITINGGGATRLFFITGDGFQVFFDHLTLTGGRAASGGAIYLDYRYGLNTLTMSNATVHGNHATQLGGAIWVSYSTLRLYNTTFYNNTTDWVGGGIYSNYGPLVIENSTFTNNRAPNNGSGFAGAINTRGTLLILRNNTFFANQASRGAHLSLYSVALTAANNIFANGLTSNDLHCACSDVAGCAIGGVSNIATSNQCGGTVIATSQALFAPLGDYGGDTPTLPLLPGHPAIDAGDSCLATDQRGVTRSAPTCDAGAFESQGFTLMASGGDNQTTFINTDFAAPLGLAISANGALEPVAGGRVTFAPPGSGASAVISSNPATIGSDGAVSVTATANGSVGAYSVTASATGATAISFNLENVSPILYAIPGGAASGYCASWANACELRYALSSAITGQEIWVQAGVYTPTAGSDRSATFQLKNGVAIYGGFAGTETARDQRDPAANVVTLSGDLNGDDVGFTNSGENSYHVVTGATGATLDGVTISGGNANGSAPNDRGGGMTNVSSSPTLTGVTFRANQAAGAGGGMANWTSSPTLTGVTFQGNAAGSGGGMYNYASSPTVTAVTFSSNSASIYGGGVYNYQASNAILTNVTFHNNSANTAGGSLRNGNSDPQIRNAVLWGNTAPSGPQLSNNVGLVTIRNSVVQGGCPAATTCTNIITAEPLLGVPGDYGGSAQTIPLLPGSSAIDAGSAADCTLGHDQRGVSYTGVCDLGAFESQGFTLGNLSGSDQVAFIGTAFAAPLGLTVMANDASEPVAGGQITFTPPASGASAAISGSPATIGADGTASVTATANSTAGSYSVTASTVGATAVSFALHNVSPILYALPGGATSGACDSWANACELRYALAFALDDSGQEIWVAAGTYTPTSGDDRTATFQLKRDVALYGGFAGTETAREQRDPAANVVILNGNIGHPLWRIDNVYHVVTGTTGATLDGLTISGGNADGTAPHNSGGGLCNAAGSMMLTNVTFSGNWASIGGGMANLSSSPTLINVTFSGNSAAQHGGGLHNTASSPTLTNVTFSGNSATFGGGIYNAASSPTLTAVTFSGNLDSLRGGGIYNDASHPQVRNSILWGNTGGQIYNANGSTPTVNDSVVQGGCAGGTNIITVDPLLGSLGSHGGVMQTIPLLPGSSAIDATGNNCPATDQRGVTRSAPACDMGAFESQGFTFGSLTGTPQSAPINTAFVTPLGLIVTANDASEPVAGGQITFTPPGSGPSAAVSGSPATIGAGGAASVTATANGIVGGPYDVVASAAGAATSVNFGLTNTRANTTVTLTSSPNPSTYGQAVIFTATVAPSAAGGTVAFKDGGVTLPGCDAQPLSGGQATCTTAALSTGTHPNLAAEYSGDANHNGSTSGNYMQTVDKAAATVTLGDLSQTYDGAPKPVSATTTPLGLTVVLTYTGSGGTVYGPSTTAPTNAGTYQVDAAVDDANYQGAASDTLTIGKADTTTALTSDPNPSVYGQTVVFTATVSPATAAGTVAFEEGGLALSGCEAQPLTGGEATCTTAALALGMHEISAVYGGDANHTGSPSDPLDQTVNQAPTTTALDSSVNPSQLNQTVTFTATVSPVSASGTVTFRDNGVTISGCEALAVSGGQATCTTSALALGAHPITAEYNGDANHTGSVSSPLTQMVYRMATTTTVVSSQNPSGFGESVTFTATVSPSAASGTVEFQVNGASITDCWARPLSSGQATCATDLLPVGVHQITAVYSGDALYNVSAGTLDPDQQVGCHSALIVTSDASVGPGSLEDAIANVCPGGMITFAGDYTIRLGSTLIVDKDVTIDGVGRSVTVSGDGNDDGVGDVRVFYVNAGVSFHLNQVTVAHGSADKGGGLYNEGTVQVTNSTFSSNTATVYGGGLYNAGTLTVTLSTFSSNTTDLMGGGIYNFSDHAALREVVFRENSAFFGGGMYNESSSPTLTDVTFHDNDALEGGGMHNQGSNLTLARVTFRDNTAFGYGGGMSNLSSSPTLTNVTFSGNMAGFGGGLRNEGGSSPTLTNVTLSDNSASDSGGGMYNAYGSNPQVRNSILWGNTAANGAQILDDGSATTVTYSVVEGGWAGTGNLAANPLLLPLGDYGGSTQTQALPSNSPAIDAGDPVPASCAATDQRGQARADLRCDVGAYELVYADSDTVIRPVATTLTTFGPALAGIERDAGYVDPGVITLRKEAGGAPGLESIAVMWDITPAVSSGFRLSLQLCYTDAELGSLDENDLRFWRNEGGGWAQVGGAPTLSTVNGYHCAALSGVEALSVWTLATDAPTAVELAWFTATARDGAIALDWETASEIDLLGFHVYCAEAVDGPRTRLTEDLLPGQAPGSPVGASYEFVDEAVAPGVSYWYWLEAVDVRGAAILHGPMSAAVPGGASYRVYLPLVLR